MLKILHVDIETAPKQAFVWGMWKQNISPIQLISDWFMLSWRAKWHHSDVIYGAVLTEQDAIDEDDGHILQELWDMLDEADVVVGHNVDKFDAPSINTRFLVNGLTPPSPYKTVDTLKVAKRKFKFSSNRLDYLGEFLGVGRKMDTGGMELWIECLKGNEEALQKMYEYNGQDVLLLQEVYTRLLPYIPHHPNHNTSEHLDKHSCTRCGSEHVVRRGYYSTNLSKFQRYKCNSCGAWSRARVNVRTKEEMSKTLMPI